jgi:hypothetical protein
MDQVSTFVVSNKPLRQPGIPAGEGYERAAGHTADPSTTLLRSSVEKHFQERTAGPQISPLRFAPVEMTKGKAALPLSVVAEQSLFFMTFGGPKAHNFSGRDDKGAGVGGRKQWALRQQAH